ncbi:MAG TPA: hypothetical protein DEP88_02360 [Verrucomicrobiales bacterium]|jgi:hypothetical protein|nr:hypothetical protein [Akkermansiaceae bacterium]HCC20079.1 hypothetical protein [Verrucomicrobiales bacterium]HCI92458.1 hypothetical protein [Verrucomicrobiales bacterium]HCL97602.1 hypothetical protein [Verrucomicrobiales bacterium]
MKSSPISIASLIFGLVLLPMIASAQNNTSNKSASEATGPRRFWQASLPGGNYIVALDRISSISKHDYVLNGNLRVTEVIIDTNGNALARFYYIIPVTEDSGSNVGARLTTRGKELLDKVGERTGVNANTAVAKQYPNTTHAKTIEFRISDEGNLNKLFGSASNAWIKGIGRKFSIRNE